MRKFDSKGLLAGISSAVITAAAAISLTAVSASAAEIVYGDANCDGKVSIADATAILQHIGNTDKYKLSDKGMENADVYNRGDGLSGMDALSIQKLDAKLLDKLPESWKDGAPAEEDPVADATKIHLKGTTAEVEGDYAEVKDNVITITHSGSFYIDGALEDGQINVAIPDEAADPETVKLFLNGVNITGKSAPAILVTNAENTSINIVDGTENFIQDGDTAYPGGDALVFAKDDLTIKGGDEGTGILNITANTQNAIACNNDIKFTGGITTIKTNNKTDKTNGVNGKKSVTVKGGVLNIDAEGDGLKSSKGDVAIKEGYVTIKAGNDAIQAETTIDISGGEVVAGGDRGLTAVTGINITGGKVAATAKDNQVDKALLAGSTQGTMLFNCIDCPDAEDGTWKKGNSFGFATFTKKYKFVLISDSSFAKGKEYTFKNASNDAAVTYGDKATAKFKLADIITAFDKVNPGTADAASTDPAPTPDPEAKAYTITLDGSSVKSNAPSDAYLVS